MTSSPIVHVVKHGVSWFSNRKSHIELRFSEKGREAGRQKEIFWFIEEQTNARSNIHLKSVLAHCGDHNLKVWSKEKITRTKLIWFDFALVNISDICLRKQFSKFGRCASVRATFFWYWFFIVVGGLIFGGYICRAIFLWNLTKVVVWMSCCLVNVPPIPYEELCEKKVE